MNNPDHISESLENISWVKILKFVDADRGWKNSDQGYRIHNTGIKYRRPT
jgi:hypothetical protein